MERRRCMAGLQEFAARAAEGGGQPAHPLVRVLMGAGAPLPDRLAVAERAPAFSRAASGAQRLREAVSRLRGGAGSLNPSQLAAVEAALSQTLTLWQVHAAPTLQNPKT
jgi:hypothetical protein